MRKIKELCDICILMSYGTADKKLACTDSNNEKAEDLNRPTITANAIENGYIEDDFVDAVDYKEVPMCTERTKLDDIVISLIEPFKAAIIDEEHIDYLVSNNCAVINAWRWPNGVNKYYLLAYLNSNYFSSKLKEKIKSPNKPITLQSFRDCDLILPHLEVQIEIGQTYKKYLERVMLNKKISKLEMEKINALVIDAKDK